MNACIQLGGFWEWRLLCPSTCGFSWGQGFGVVAQLESRIVVENRSSGEDRDVLGVATVVCNFFPLKGVVKVCAGRGSLQAKSERRWRNSLSSKTDVRKAEPTEDKDQRSRGWTLSFTHRYWLTDISH